MLIILYHAVSLFTFYNTEVHLRSNDFPNYLAICILCNWAVKGARFDISRMSNQETDSRYKDKTVSRFLSL